MATSATEPVRYPVVAELWSGQLLPAHRPAPTESTCSSVWSIVPDTVPTAAPSRYSVWVFLAHVRTAKCHLLSATDVVVPMGSSWPFQNSPCRSPDVPT